MHPGDLQGFEIRDVRDVFAANYLSYMYIIASIDAELITFLGHPETSRSCPLGLCHCLLLHLARWCFRHPHQRRGADPIQHGVVPDLLIHKKRAVQPDQLRLLTNPQPQEWNVLHDYEQDIGHAERVRTNGADLCKLLANLNAFTVDGSRDERAAVQRGDVLVGENTGQKRADYAADPV